MIESYADNETGNAWLSKATLTADTGLDARTVDAHIARLCALGWLELLPGAGKHGTHVYRVAPVATDRRAPVRGPGRPPRQGGADKPPTPRVGGFDGGAIKPPSLDGGGYPKNHPHRVGGGAIKPPSLDAPRTADPERTAVCAPD